MINNLDVKHYLFSELNALKEVPDKVVKTLPAKLLIDSQFYNEFKKTCIKIDQITLQYQGAVNFCVEENPVSIEITREITKNFKRTKTVTSQLNELVHGVLSFQYDLQRLSRQIQALPINIIQAHKAYVTNIEALIFKLESDIFKILLGRSLILANSALIKLEYIISLTLYRLKTKTNTKTRLVKSYAKQLFFQKNAYLQKLIFIKIVYLVFITNNNLVRWNPSKLFDRKKLYGTKLSSFSNTLNKLTAQGLLEKKVDQQLSHKRGNIPSHVLLTEKGCFVLEQLLIEYESQS